MGLNMDYNPDDDPEGATPLDPDEIEGLKLKHVTTRGDERHIA